MATVCSARRDRSGDRRTVRAAVLALAISTAGASLAVASPWDRPGDAGAGEGAGDSTYVVLRLGERRLYLMQESDDGRDRRLASFRVAIGREQWATPTGRFAVREMIVDPDWVQFDWDDPSRVVGRVASGPDNPLGVRWIGFTAAYGWTIGFHGTPNPELLGQAVSHGCVRMRNRDVVELYDRVRIGTPVLVEP